MPGKTAVRCKRISAQVDTKLAPLIKEMWKAGLATWSSHNRNMYYYVSIELASFEDFIRFLNIVGTGDEADEGLRARLVMDDSLAKHWIYDLHVRDFYRSSDPHFAVGVDVKFPRPDLPLVLKRLKKYNRDN